MSKEKVEKGKETASGLICLEQFLSLQLLSFDDIRKATFGLEEEMTEEAIKEALEEEEGENEEENGDIQGMKENLENLTYLRTTFNNKEWKDLAVAIRDALQDCGEKVFDESVECFKESCLGKSKATEEILKIFDSTMKEEIDVNDKGIKVSDKIEGMFYFFINDELPYSYGVFQKAHHKKQRIEEKREIALKKEELNITHVPLCFTDVPIVLMKIIMSFIPHDRTCLSKIGCISRSFLAIFYLTWDTVKIKTETDVYSIPLIVIQNTKKISIESTVKRGEYYVVGDDVEGENFAKSQFQEKVKYLFENFQGKILDFHIVIDLYAISAILTVFGYFFSKENSFDCLNVNVDVKEDVFEPDTAHFISLKRSKTPSGDKVLDIFVDCHLKTEDDCCKDKVLIRAFKFLNHFLKNELPSQSRSFQKVVLNSVRDENDIIEEYFKDDFSSEQTKNENIFIYTIKPK